MLTTLIIKELKSILLSPKFTATFAVCSLLMLLSTFIGIQEYRSSVKQHETAVQLVDRELREKTDWMAVSNRIYRKPDPLSIFVTGITNDIGRWSSVDHFNTVKLRHSSYSDDPIFALFRFVDFTFIVQIVLSLFAILFTYDSINGERESGMLKLVFSNAVPRVQYITAKFVGSWLGLVLPLTIPLAISLLLVMLYQIPFTAYHWFSLFQLTGISLLYFTFFMALGIFISAMTKHSNVSFLLSFVIWILLVLIIPRVGIITAGQLVTVPNAAEIEGQRDSFAKDRWEQFKEDSEKRFQERQAQMSGMSEEEQEKYQDDNMWTIMVMEDSLRKQVERDINNYSVKLNEDLRNRKAVQEQLGFILSRFSPASSYQLAVMNLAQTDIYLKSRYEQSLLSYRDVFNQYTDKKQKQSGEAGGIRITMDSEKGFSFSTPREKGTLNISDMPSYEHPQTHASFPMLDFGLLVFFSVIAFSGAFIGFLRYDVR
ncbi:MAG: ABC transporter permease [Ignavibacteriae bacterium]|nr:ABC transporter permease [Ignavibacteriota bacterium]